MKKLTGGQRAQFTIEWIKRGKPPTRESFIKRCCDVLRIEYVEPPKLKPREERETITMFPIRGKSTHDSS